MQFEHLACFAAVADHLHFGRAAEKLMVSPSALSKRVSELERELGVALFLRTTRQVRLTPAGVTLLEPAQRVLHDMETLRSIGMEAALGRAGSVLAGYSSGNGETMAALVRAMRERHGSLVEVHLEQRTSAQVIEAVRSGEMSFGIGRVVAPAGGLAGLNQLVVSCTPYDQIALPRDHRLACRTELRAADLADEIFVVPYPSIVAGLDLATEGALAVSGGQRPERITSEGELIDRVAAGLGLGLLDADMAARNQRSDVRFVPYIGPPEPTLDDNHLFWRADDESPVVAEFVALVRDWVPWKSKVDALQPVQLSS
jgi:DNA-binding transcriptional LysR family regulator